MAVQLPVSSRILKRFSARDSVFTFQYTLNDNKQRRCTARCPLFTGENNTRSGQLWTRVLHTVTRVICTRNLQRDLARRCGEEKKENRKKKKKQFLFNRHAAS